MEKINLLINIAKNKFNYNGNKAEFDVVLPQETALKFDGFFDYLTEMQNKIDLLLENKEDNFPLSKEESEIYDKIFGGEDEGLSESLLGKEILELNTSKLKLENTFLSREESRLQKQLLQEEKCLENERKENE